MISLEESRDKRPQIVFLHKTVYKSCLSLCRGCSGHGLEAEINQPAASACTTGISGSRGEHSMDCWPPDFQIPLTIAQESSPCRQPDAAVTSVGASCTDPALLIPGEQRHHLWCLCFCCFCCFTSCLPVGEFRAASHSPSTCKYLNEGEQPASSPIRGASPTRFG